VALLEATARAAELMVAAALVLCGLVVWGGASDEAEGSSAGRVRGRRRTGSRDAWLKEEERKEEKERKRRERKRGK
jgi:hypothetical protein